MWTCARASVHGRPASRSTTARARTRRRATPAPQAPANGREQHRKGGHSAAWHTMVWASCIRTGRGVAMATGRLDAAGPAPRPAGHNLRHRCGEAADDSPVAATRWRPAHLRRELYNRRMHAAERHRGHRYVTGRSAAPGGCTESGCLHVEPSFNTRRRPTHTAGHSHPTPLTQRVVDYTM